MFREKELVRAEPCFTDFRACLVGGSAEDRACGRKIKRRAIAISIALEGAALTALVFLPLLAKPAELAVRSTVPIPPYSTRQRSQASANPIAPRHATRVCIACARLPVALITPAFETQRPSETTDVDTIPGATTGPDTANALINGISDVRPQPARPVEPPRQTRLRQPNIDPALLIDRVEPVFPALARQIRRNGKVELHAIIATDGTIQSLEVVSGDPLFVGSALDAVGQWRYKPTYLNGQPVEIDTFITVIYTVQQQ
jgi:protein TonB